MHPLLALPHRRGAEIPQFEIRPGQIGAEFAHEEDVIRLDIAVHHGFCAAVVNDVQGLGHLDEDVPDEVLGDSAAHAVDEAQQVAAAAVFVEEGQVAGFGVGELLPEGVDEVGEARVVLREDVLEHVGFHRVSFVHHSVIRHLFVHEQRAAGSFLHQ